MRVLFLIVARGGSKGIKDKNLQEIGGISLVGYKAISARQSRHCARLIISTDSVAIQENARSYGVEVPFTRPPELATDSASSVDVIKHAMDWVENQGEETYDALMLLEPSSPFATAADYDGAIELMARSGANVVLGIRPVEVNSVFVGSQEADGRFVTVVENIKSLRSLSRQSLPREYTMNGCLYLMNWRYFKEAGSIYSDTERTYGYTMDRYYSIEIDEAIDLDWARFLMQRGYVDQGHWVIPESASEPATSVIPTQGTRALR